MSSGLWILVVPPLIGAAAGGEPIFQLFLQRFDDCGLFGGEVDGFAGVCQEIVEFDFSAFQIMLTDADGHKFEAVVLNGGDVFGLEGDGMRSLAHFTAN